MLYTELHEKLDRGTASAAISGSTRIANFVRCINNGKTSTEIIGSLKIFMDIIIYSLKNFFFFIDISRI